MLASAEKLGRGCDAMRNDCAELDDTRCQSAARCNQTCSGVRGEARKRDEAKRELKTPRRLHCTNDEQPLINNCEGRRPAPRATSRGSVPGWNVVDRLRRQVCPPPRLVPDDQEEIIGVERARGKAIAEAAPPP